MFFVPRASKVEQKKLAIWAADCASRVLRNFEKKYPKDKRPRKAIAACRAWARGKISVGEARKAAWAAHAAARRAKDESAKFAARSAGHAVATAHVPEHAIGAAIYALKSSKNKKEINWQIKHMPTAIRKRKVYISKPDK